MNTWRVCEELIPRECSRWHQGRGPGGEGATFQPSQCKDVILLCDRLCPSPVPQPGLALVFSCWRQGHLPVMSAGFQSLTIVSCRKWSFGSESAKSSPLDHQGTPHAGSNPFNKAALFWVLLTTAQAPRLGFPVPFMLFANLSRRDQKGDFESPLLISSSTQTEGLSQSQILRRENMIGPTWASVKPPFVKAEWYSYKHSCQGFTLEGEAGSSQTRVVGGVRAVISKTFSTLKQM